MMTGVGTAVLTLLLLSEIAAEYRPECMDLDEVAKYDVIFRGLVTHVPAGYVLFSILEVYKGGVNFGGRRKVGVLIRKNTPCDKKAIEYRQYIVMTKGSTSDITPWSIEKESIVWSSLGWHQWSEWSPCSQTCNGGKQERRRICSRPSCPGPIVERRECNTFDCNGSISLLDLEEKRYFHPARRTWERVPDRQTAWSLHQNSYVWVPAFQLFHDGTFPKDFSLLITLRIRSIPTGTLFSVRCRRQQDTFLSLEIAGENGVTLIHSGPNGTQSVNVSARLADGHWHQISMSVRDRSIVRSYIDCQWISTVVLKKNSLMIPDDADIVIGYLFLGDLEQLVLVPKVGAESEQCSSKKTSEPPNLYTYKDSPYHSESVLKEWMRYVPNYGVRHVNILCKHECLNGGKCVGPDQCECPRNSTGPTCALPVCEPPCEHAATCAAGNRCVCAPVESYGLITFLPKFSNGSSRIGDSLLDSKEASFEETK